MKNCIIFLVLLYAISLYARQFITGQVFNDSTDLGIADVQVMVSDRGVLTDSAGCFSIRVDSLTSWPVKVNFRHILYEPSGIDVDYAGSWVSVRLRDRTFTTHDITVTAEMPFELKSPVSARTITKKQIEKQVPSVVADVLATDPAISSKSHYQSPIVLRGLTGYRLLILRNGNRRAGSYPAGFMTHTINIYDLERIEMQKGPASVAYGAGAIAGIINLVDKSPFKRKGFDLRVTSAYSSNNHETGNQVCGGWSNGKLGVKAALNFRHADAYHYADGSIASNSFYRDMDGFAAIGYRFLHHDIQLHAELHTGGPWGQPLGFSGTRYLYVRTPHENCDNFDLDWHYHRAENMLSDCRFSAYFANDYREQEQLYLNAGTKLPSYRENTYFSDKYYGANFKPTLTLYDNVSLQAGVEYYAYHVSSPMDITDYYEGLYFHNRVCRNARSTNWGLFTELTFKPAPRVLLMSGLRYDCTHVYEGEVYSTEQDYERDSETTAKSATLTIQLPTGGCSRLKINLARAFRMPTPQEMFTNTYTANGVLYGNPALLPEFSWNADLVWTFSNSHFDFECSPFYWLLDNMINKELVDHMPGLNYQYINIGRARLWGGETAITATFNNIFTRNNRLRVHGGAAFTHATDISITGTGKNNIPLDHIPPLQYISELEYEINFSSKLNTGIAFRLQHSTRQERLPDAAYSTPAYTLASVMLDTEYHAGGNTITFRLLINNIFNTEYYAFQSLIPGKGRDIRLFWSYNWG